MQDRQRASIAIKARAAYYERTSVQKLDQPTACAQRQISLRGAPSVQFRRIDVGDADILAFDLNRVAIMDAVVARTGCTNGEGSKQKRVVPSCSFQIFLFGANNSNP